MQALRGMQTHDSHAATSIARLVGAGHIHVSLQRRMFPPRVTGTQYIPLWNIAGPTLATF